MWLLAPQLRPALSLSLHHEKIRTAYDFLLERVSISYLNHNHLILIKLSTIDATVYSCQSCPTHVLQFVALCNHSFSLTDFHSMPSARDLIFSYTIMHAHTQELDKTKSLPPGQSFLTVTSCDSQLICFRTWTRNRQTIFVYLLLAHPLSVTTLLSIADWFISRAYLLTVKWIQQNVKTNFQICKNNILLKLLSLLFSEQCSNDELYDQLVVYSTGYTDVCLSDLSHILSKTAFFRFWCCLPIGSTSI